MCLVREGAIEVYVLSLLASLAAPGARSLDGQDEARTKHNRYHGSRFFEVENC